MIKLSAHYSRKVPGAEQYSSEQCGATIEMELESVHAGRIQEQLDMLQHELKTWVDRQIEGGPSAPTHGPAASGPANGPSSQPVNSQPHQNGNGHPPHNSNGQAPANGNGHQQTRYAEEPSHATNYTRPSNGNGGYQGQGNGQGSGNTNGQGYQSSGRSQAATKKQINFLLVSARRNRDWSADDTRRWVFDCCGCSLDGLTKSQAGKLIDELQGKVTA